jgi:hypothetical protein
MRGLILALLLTTAAGATTVHYAWETNDASDVYETVVWDTGATSGSWLLSYDALIGSTYQGMGEILFLDQGLGYVSMIHGAYRQFSGSIPVQAPSFITIDFQGVSSHGITGSITLTLTPILDDGIATPEPSTWWLTAPALLWVSRRAASSGCSLPSQSVV